MVGIGMSIGMSQSVKQEIGIEQRLAMKLQQELKLKMTLEQVMQLVQKLWPQLKLELGQKLEAKLMTLIRNDATIRAYLPEYLARQPTAVELQKAFPQLSPVFNEYYKGQPNYGTNLRQGYVVAPQRKVEGPQMTLSLRSVVAIQQQIVSAPPTNWSLVDAYEEEGNKGCGLSKKKLEGLEKLGIEERLKRIDDANEPFRYEYVQRGRKFFKVPLVRNYNIHPEDISIRISGSEYRQATKLLEKAGKVQRIVRAVPYSEIRHTLIDHVASKDIDLDDVVIVGIDRGGRLPTNIVRKALGKNIAYFLKVDQGGRMIDDERIKRFTDDGTFRGKYIIFVDSTVDSGRQIAALSKYFDDEDLKAEIGHRGWIVAGSNEYGKSLEDHINIDWGLDPDSTFEDNPQLMGVDYGRSHTKVRACGNKMSTELKSALLEVPGGTILDTQSITPRKKELKAKATVQPQDVQQDITRNLLIIGDGQSITLSEDDARNLALKIEHGFHVMAGTMGGNPGYMLELVSAYSGHKGVTLMQPAYLRGRTDTNGYHVVYEGSTKDQWRDCMIGKADVVIALGGNDGTWSEIQKSVSAGKPTIIVGDSGRASALAKQQYGGNTSIYLADTLENAIKKVSEYR